MILNQVSDIDAATQFFETFFGLHCTYRREGQMAILADATRNLRTGEGGFKMAKAIRLFLMFEGAAFIAASLTHFGVLLHGFEHRMAGTAESVIGIVLLMGLLLSWIWPASTRGIGLGVQTFALLGTFVGIYTIAIGVGPRTPADIIFHVAIVIVLIFGLVVTFRARVEARHRSQQS